MLPTVLSHLSQFIPMWILPFISRQINKIEIVPYNMMKCIILWKKAFKTYRKAANYLFTVFYLWDCFFLHLKMSHSSLW